MSYYSDSLFNFLLNEADESETAAPNISDAENDTTDLKDSQDMQSDDDNDNDSEDQDNESNDDENSSDESDDSSNSNLPNSNDDNDSESGDGSDDSNTTEDEETDDSEEEDSLTLRKKLNIYNNLISLLSAFKSLDGVYDRLTMMDVDSKSQNIFSLFSEKIKYDISKLNELLYESNAIKDFEYPELLALYNTYTSDMNAIKSNIKLVIQAMGVKNLNANKLARRNLKKQLR